VYVEVAGRGAPLVLLHGWALNLRVFDSLVPMLDSTHEVIRVDLPGHGRTPWDTRAATLGGQAAMLHETLVKLPGTAPPYVLVGWSLGGQIALELAARQSDHVRALVLVATSPRYTRVENWPHGPTRAALGRLAGELSRDWRSAVAEFLDLQVRGSSERERVLRELRAALDSHGEPDPRALAAGLQTLGSADLRERLAAIRQPALTLAGQYDRITPPGSCRELATRLPAGRYAEVRRAGHAPFLSHPGEVARLVLEFTA
jgi:pimeloyl-[acyl-carrier protein] methyl ester esterase